MRKKVTRLCLAAIALLLIVFGVIYAKDMILEKGHTKKIMDAEEKEETATAVQTRISEAKNAMEELGEVFHVEYKVDFPSGYAEERAVSENVDFQTITSNCETITYDHKAKNYLKTPSMEADDFVAELPVEERMQVDEETGQPIWYYRTNLTGFSYAKESLFQQERAFGYLYDFGMWDIVGEEQVAGRNCWKVEGVLSGSYSEKLNVETFHWWVDKENGCLLKYEGYSADNELTEHLTTSEAEFDVPAAVTYDSSKIPEGYVDLAEEQLKLLDEAMGQE